MNCIECQQTATCSWQKCNMIYLNGKCPDKECTLLENRHLKGLPDYCFNKDKEPYRCPLLRDSEGIRNDY